MAFLEASIADLPGLSPAKKKRYWFPSIGKYQGLMTIGRLLYANTLEYCIDLHSLLRHRGKSTQLLISSLNEKTKL